MRAAAHLEYDESNQSLYAWVAFIITPTKKYLDFCVFPTLGHAQQYYKPFVGEWKQTEPGGKWYAKFNTKYPDKDAIQVDLQQLLYMGDDQCGTDSGVVPLGEKK